MIRRIHMYAGLALTPWVLMYALSTMAMNHREHLGTPPLEFRRVEERRYEAVFTEGVGPWEQGGQVLRDLGMEGAYSAAQRDGALVVNRNDLLEPKRITLKEESLLIEAAERRPAQMLERMHRRRGFSQPFWTDRLWGALVDGFIVVMLTWAITGVLLWWEMRVTRRLGAAFLIAGLAAFTFFLLTI
ncbi:MAG: hypothetical protein IPP90_09715 [Gemmatimonadaceae bacterium]|nr:hypothetical protein [Gemmatimonadaceae bacterium]